MTRAVWMMCAVLLTAAGARVWGQTVGEPFVLESEASHQPAFGDEFYGAAAAGPGEYFAVWLDVEGSSSAYDLYGQRVRPDGTLATPGSIELHRDPDRSVSGLPAVAWNGTVYLVVWLEHQPLSEDQSLYGMRVSAEGQVLDPGGFLIDSRPALAWPAVASDGEGFLVVQATSSGIAAVRVGGDGTVLDPTPLILSSNATDLSFPKVSFGGGVYLVVWAQRPDEAILGARITSAGQALDPGGFSISGGGPDFAPWIDFDGQRFFIVWQRTDGLFRDLLGAHVTPQGSVAPGPTLVLDGNAWGTIIGGQIAWNGAHHLVSITTPEPVISILTDAYALRVDASGAAVGGPFPVSAVAGRPEFGYAVASLGSQWFVSFEGGWYQGTGFITNSEGARIDAGGTVLDQPALAVSTSAAWQHAAASAFDGTNFLSVFEDRRDGPHTYYEDLYAVRVTPDGVPIEAGGFRIAGGHDTREHEPHTAFGGGRHAVVYVREHGSTVSSEVRLTRVLPDSTVLDPDGILVFSNNPNGVTRNPRVASSAARYGVIWHDNSLVGGETPLQFALVGHDGALVAGPVNVPQSGSAGPSGHGIVSDGGGFLVTWVDVSGSAIRAVAFDGAGVAGTPRVISSSTGSTVTAWNGRTYLAAWAEWAGGQRYVRARPLGPDGAPTGPMATVSGPLSSVTCRELLVRGGEFVLLTTGYAAYRLGDDGSALGPPVTFTLPSGGGGGGPIAHPAWAMGPGGRLLFTFSRWHSDPYNAHRAQGRIVEPWPCAPDLNGDGQVSVQDFLAFLSAYSEGEPGGPADFNGDGAITVQDFLAFLSAYAAGCT